MWPRETKAQQNWVHLSWDIHWDQQLSCSWWRHQMETFPRCWRFVWGIHRSPLNSPHKGQWRGALMYSEIWAWTNGWVNNRDAGGLWHHRAYYDVTIMVKFFATFGVGGSNVNLLGNHWLKSRNLGSSQYTMYYTNCFLSAKWNRGVHRHENPLNLRFGNTVLILWLTL